MRAREEQSFKGSFLKTSREDDLRQRGGQDVLQLHGLPVPGHPAAAHRQDVLPAGGDHEASSWMESSRGEEARGSEEARSEEASRRSEEASKRSKEAKSEKGSRRSEEASKRSKEPMSEEASSRSEEAKREEASKRSKEAKSEEARRRSEEASRRSEEARSEEASRSEEARSEEASRRSEEARSEEASRRSEEPRSEEARRRSAASLCCSSDGEESLNYAPMSPTFKKLLIQFYPDEVNSRVSTDGKCSIIERTESLRKSTSHIKKTPSPVVVSKIDKKLELYAQALEVSTKDGRPGAQTPTDLTSPAERVSSKKSLFEPGDTRRHNAPPGSPSKDADGLKVGVANLINQWVGGSEGGSRCSSSCRPAVRLHTTGSSGWSFLSATTASVSSPAVKHLSSQGRPASFWLHLE
uniref:Uncharacterized protein n=1 Tax=Gasterosteus aculeatus aculeatus TaxID=481459 RepID=A0AAQ4QFQ5_GASAC